MPYVNGNGTYHDRRTCRRLHNTGRRIRRVDAAGDRDACPNCTDADTEAGAPTDTADGRTDAERDIAGMIDMGVCPWCPQDTDRYEGDHVGQHASSAHPQAWAAYKDATAD
jgi:hypothetical protein